jgi:predicted oxidoreductase
MRYEADVLVIGAGLAGLVAATEAASRGRSVMVLDQEPEHHLGGQAFWSFGGLFFVDSPEQRRLRIRDSFELAWQDWQGWQLTVKRAFGRRATEPVELFKERGADFIVSDSLAELVERMNLLVGSELLSFDAIEREILARDRELSNPFTKDAQVMGIHNARRSLGERLVRTAKPHRILDPAHGPLIAVRLNIITRKTLGGLETDLDSRVFGQGGNIVQGLYAAGEIAGFGGGGMHGYRALEGSFLGGCLFSGRAAGRAAASDVT